ncbi:MAG: SRPBCC family protein [Streptosporangiaceae bacterium]
MNRAIGAGVAAGAAVGIHLRWVRPRIFSWGATPEEAGRPMAGDEVCPRPQLNATRAVTIAARPGEVWPWLVQWGWNRAGFYSYDLLDNLGRPSAQELLSQFQRLAVGDWVPMSGKTTPYTAYQVTRLEPGRLMLWEKSGGTWLWLLEPAGPERTRLITRMRGRYRWTRPAIVTELVLMEIGDPFMMRKCLLGIKQRAERLAAGRRRRVAGTAAEHRPEVTRSRSRREASRMSLVVVEAEVDIDRPPEDVFDYCSDHRHEPEWNPMMKRIEKLTDGPIGAGTRYAAEFVKGPPMVMECTRFERPATWSLTGDSRALTASGGWRVLPAADGARLAVRVEMEPHGLLRLAAPLLRRREQLMFARDLRNIKTRLEEARVAPSTESEEE